MTAEQCEKFILPTVKACAEEKSWRLRQAIASEFSLCVKGLPSALLNGDVASCLKELIKDNEADVRSVAVKNLSGYYKLVRK